MNIDLWQAAVAVVVASAGVAGGGRWWYGRRLAELQRQRDKLDATHQSTLKMMSQTRKQVEDLQRLVAEFRRKCTALETERRRAKEALEALDEPLAPPNGLPPIRVPGAWADTQPLS